MTQSLKKAPGLQAKVVIVGAGFAGIAMGHALREAGEHDFVILEKSHELGGVWRDNGYPSSACDVPSHLYSFSFAQDPQWSRRYAPRDEILAYLRKVSERTGLLAHIRFGCEVAALTFDDQTRRWQVRTAEDERLEAQVVISAIGQLGRPHVPEIAGLASFTGQTFHSARWPKGFDPRAKRVAVVGTGASAIQIVPGIIDAVSRLFLFQRSAPYVVARGDYAYGERAKKAFAKRPALLKLSRALTFAELELRVSAFRYPERTRWYAQRMFRRHLETHIKDPSLRAKLTPRDPFGCRRVLLSDEYFPALARPHAEVVTSPIAEVRADAIIGEDGVRRAVDVIVFATGFRSTEFLAPIEVRGEHGRSLKASWQGGAEAYLGLSVSGFPNLFLMYGPNTNLGHSSIIFMLESQARFVVDALRLLRARGAKTMDVKPAVQADFNAEIHRELDGLVWSQCASWYKQADGKNTNNWPFYPWAYRVLTQRVRAEDYEIV
jgi:cation diffusion facilitator CzcD-associated flavoprotein CzcO